MWRLQRWCFRAPLLCRGCPSPPLAEALQRRGVGSAACPECGKPFQSAATLRQHRRARHRVELPTPQEERLAGLRGANEALAGRLRDLRAAAAALKAGLKSPPERSCPEEGQGSPREGGRGLAAAVATGAVLRGVADAEFRRWARADADAAVGVSGSTWVGVGSVVEGTVRVGQLEGALPPPAGGPPDVPADVLEFTLEVVGYRERRQGQLKRFRDRVVVRYHFKPPFSERDGPQRASFTVKAGDLLRVQGNYALHESFDVVSKRLVEHVVVEADMVGVLRMASVALPAD